MEKNEISIYYFAQLYECRKCIVNVVPLSKENENLDIRKLYIEDFINYCETDKGYEFKEILINSPFIKKLEVSLNHNIYYIDIILNEF